MNCNNVKEKHCITYRLQLNLIKLNFDHSLSLRKIFQSSVVKTLPCSSCFTACLSAHFPAVKLGCGLDDSLWHGSKWGCQFDQIPAHIITRH